MGPISSGTPLPLTPVARESQWRPFSNPKNVVRIENRPEGVAVFVVDPWTQRWAILGRGAEAVLALADGTRSRPEIVAEATAVASNDHLREPRVVNALLDELRAAGLLFVSRAHHLSQGLPVVLETEPQGLHLEITNACNLSCVHCYVSSGQKLPDELSDAELRAVVDQLPPFSDKLIAITGGEAAVRRNALDLVEYCAVERGHNVDLYTNAYKFPRKFAERVVRINEIGAARVNLQVSLEGATPETNDPIRGKGVFDEVLKSLVMFKELGLNRRTQLFICITQNNIHELDAMIEIAERFDLAKLVFSQWEAQGNAADTPWESIAPTLEEWTAAGDKLLSYDNPRLQLRGNFFGDLNNARDGRYTLERSLFPKQIFAYNSFPRISPDGLIFADQLWVDPEWSLGNVRDITLAEAFRSEKFRQHIKEFRARAETIDECRSCEWVELCGGGHPGHTLSEYGHMNHKDAFCDARKYWFERYVDAHVEKVFNHA
ncbi:radical SAM protein [Actinacidiphila oryziradicis]|uniref:Radical SAM protein n=1 Tax=Actinacidiphila oryziradicis TaxID=2571141 RepID=A0A4U0RQA7_9ACTN|nr:radical SAM protein [Actinacidiphila oryziradicis]